MTTLQGKIIKFDWDYINSQDDTVEALICLTWAERQILLTMLDYIGWKTRWYSPTGATISQDAIDLWRDRISGELMFGNCWDCSDVIQCVIDDIDGGGDIFIKIGVIIGGGSGGIDTIFDPPGSFYENLADGIETCDKDYLFGFTLQLVQFINRVITDCFQQLEALTNFVEFFQALADGIPYLTQFTDMLALFQSNIYENYLASYDVDYENGLACELMCHAFLNNCELTWELLLEILHGRTSQDWQNLTPRDFFAALFGGSWGGDLYADVGFYLFAYVLAQSQEFFGIRLEHVQSLSTALLNDPNEDWAILCDCAWVIDILLDSEHEEAYWTVVYGDLQINRVASVGIPAISKRGLVINIIYPENDAPTDLVQVYYRYDGLGENPQGKLSLFNVSDVELDSKTFTPAILSGTTWSVYTWHFGIASDVHRVKIELYANTVDDEGYGAISTNEVILAGTGDNPFA